MSSLLILSPALRLLPHRAAGEAGRVGWAAALPVLPLLVLYTLYLGKLFEAQSADTGMAEFTLLQLGERIGRPILFAFGAWFLFYGGFLLRAAADRLVTTVYPQASPRPFLLSMGGLCLFAALGSLRSLGRFAKIVLPLLLSVLLGVLLISLKDVQRVNLLPLTILDLPAMLRAGLPLLDVLGPGLFLPLFLLPQVEREAPLRPQLLAWVMRQLLLLSLLSLTVIGKYGAELVSQLTHPFFTLVRNLVLFHSFERIEALLVSFWIFPDFLLIALCFYAAQYCIRTALGIVPAVGEGPRFSMLRMRWVIPLCSLCAIAVGSFLAPDLTRLRRLSEQIIPAFSLFFCFLSPLLIDLGGRLRRQKKPHTGFSLLLRVRKRGE